MSEMIVGALSSADVAAIRTVSDRFTKLLIGRDFEGLVQLYTSDAVVMPPHHPALRGSTAFAQWISNFPRVIAMTLAVEDVDGRADLAYVRGTYTMTLQPEGAPAPVEDKGKYLEIRRRQADGSWPIAVDTFNSDNP